MAETMNAITQTKYGAPTEVLHYTPNTPIPTPTATQILIRVVAASPHKGDSHLIRGEPFLVRLLFGGISKPTVTTPGTDISGVVTSLGADVTTHKIGDCVFADLSSTGFGGFAEYAVVDAAHAVKVPENVEVKDAAALGCSAIAAWQATQLGGVGDGDLVLVNGASGGVGSYAVQMATAAGARVTAVCSQRKREFVKRLGGEKILDSAELGSLKGCERYDVVIDAAMYQSPLSYVSVLKKGGRYVGVGGDTKFFFQLMLGVGLVMRWKGRVTKLLDSKPETQCMQKVKELVEQGKVLPMLDAERFKLMEASKAVERIEKREVVGKIIIDVAEDS